MKYKKMAGKQKKWNITKAFMLGGILSVFFGGISGQKVQAATTLQNPQTDSNGVVTWDCIYFGNYPQSDATGATKEPIKWRVLSVNGNDAFLVANKNLDVQRYNDTDVNVTWETCTMRSWLNGYGSGSNVCGKDYTSNNFIDRAFTTSEQSIIQTTVVTNTDNSIYGTDGGSNTRDKVFLLSYDEVRNENYGFNTDYKNYDAARKRTNTAYTEAGGVIGSTDIKIVGNSGKWWLRSSGYASNCAMILDAEGFIYPNGSYVYDSNRAVCPALHLNIASSDLWSYAGTVSSDGSYTDPVNVTSVTLNSSKLSMKDTDQTTLVATVKPTNADNKTVIWSSENEKVAKVTQDGVVTGVGAGTTMIMVTTEDGGFTASCVVTVVKSCDVLGHSWNAGTVTKQPKATENGEKTYTCTRCAATKTEAIPATGGSTESSSNQETTSETVETTTGEKVIVQNNTKIIYVTKDAISLGDKLDILGILYKVTSIDKKTLSCIGLVSQNITYIEIPAEVEIENLTYKVTGIAQNAFKNNKNIKRITIGKNVASIGKQAFYGCKNISNLVVNTENLKKVEKGAFKGVKAKTDYGTNKKKNSYSKLISGSNKGTMVIASNGIFQITNEKKKTVSYQGTAKDNATTIKIPDTIKISSKKYKVTKIADKALKNNTKVKKVYVGKNVTAIGKDAFTGCKKLSYINISSLKLKTVGSSKLGRKKDCKVDVPKTKTAYYKKLLKKIKIKS